MFMEAALSMQPWKTHTVIPLPWRQPTLPQKLKVAIMWDDGVVVPHPLLTRGLKEVMSTMEHPDLFEISEGKALNHGRHSMSGVAPKMDMAKYWSYTAIWNLLDCPAAVFPVSRVQEKEDWTRGLFLDGRDEGNWKQCISIWMRCKLKCLG